ncbi:LysR family transcriptional regulator [Escherichia coli]|nr:LysR family transcriptional regulator [Escherichia coli]
MNKRRIPKIEHLVTFETVAMYESYSRAAEVLGLTQSAVYRQIQALEHFLQTQLFHHYKRRITLNDDGKKYLSAIKLSLDKLEYDTDAFLLKKQNTLTLLINPSFSTHVLIPKLSDFYKYHADIVINILSLSDEKDLDNFAFDAVIMREDFSTPLSESEVIYKEDIVPVCSSSIFQSSEKITHYKLLNEFVLLHQSTRKNAWAQWFSFFNLYSEKLTRGPHFNLLSMLVTAVLSGQGVALLPKYLIQKHIDNGELVIPCDTPENHNNSFILTWRKNDESMQLLSFKNWLIKNIKNN